MKRICIIAFCLCLLSYNSYSQNAYSNALNNYKQAEYAVQETIASFCRFPYEHENSLKVLERLIKWEQVLHNVNSVPVPDVARDISLKYKDLEFHVKCFIQLIRPVKGYIADLDEAQMFFLSSVLKGIGWKEKMIMIECENAYFFEYSFEDFKIMLVKNTLYPSNDYSEHRNRNRLEITFYRQDGGSGTYIVGAGKCRVIQYKDNVLTNYSKLTRAKSIIIH